MLGSVSPALAIATAQAATCSGEGGIAGQPRVAANSCQTFQSAAYARLVFTESTDSTAAETADESSTVRADGMGAGVGAFMVGILWLIRLLKNSVQRASLRLNRSLAEEK